MKYLLTALVFLCIFAHCRAQKPALDSSTFGKWPSLDNIQITDDGNYSLYTVTDRFRHIHTLTIRSNGGAWARTDTSTDFISPSFTADSRMAIFGNGHDSLII